MKEEYYTPTIDEFHVGFEYEITNGYEWVQKTFSVEDLKSFLYESLHNAVHQEQIRVKRLNEVDVQDIGFDIVHTSYDPYFVSGKYELAFTWNRGVQIKMIEGRNTWLVFLGNIKNKSELKRILKMIGYESSMCN